MQNNHDKIKILIADDEVEFASTLVSRLKLRDFRAMMVNSGQATLTAVKENPPDVLILDLRMPDLDGFEILTILKEHNPGVKVIILTGHGAAEAGREGMEKGAFDYIMKPVELKHLISRIESAFREKTAESF